MWNKSPKQPLLSISLANGLQIAAPCHMTRTKATAFLSTSSLFSSFHSVHFTNSTNFPVSPQLVLDLAELVISTRSSTLTSSSFIIHRTSSPFLGASYVQARDFCCMSHRQLILIIDVEIDS
jgi:hypothetical protein